MAKNSEHKISLQLTPDSSISVEALNKSDGEPFGLRQTITVHLDIDEAPCPEKRKLGICFSAAF